MTPYYQEAGITIYHGDCRDIELKAGSVSALVTDPPYGMAWVSKSDAFGCAISADGVRQGVRTVRAMLMAVMPALAADAHAYVFCHWQSWPDFYDAVSTHLRVRNALIWWKRTAGMGNFSQEWSKDYEAILYATQGNRTFADNSRKGSVIDGFRPVPNAQRVHPTEKPVPLLKYLIGRSTSQGEIVLDPFMGSGAALLAAQQCGRQAVGIEIEESYCEVAADRLRQAVLFGATG